MIKKATNCPSGKTLMAYAKGELNRAAIQRVEEHLLTCPLCDLAIEGLTENNAETDGLNEIQQMTQEAIATATTKSRTLRFQWQPYAAAAAIIFLLVSWSFYRAAQSPQRVFAQYFDPVPQAEFTSQRAVVGVRPKLDEQLEQALDYHLDANYPFALTAWKAYLEDYGNQSDKAFLYAANAALATGKDDLAAYYLKQLPPHIEGEFGEEVGWYRALLALKTEGGEATKKILYQMPLPIKNAIIRQNREALLSELE